MRSSLRPVGPLDATVLDVEQTVGQLLGFLTALVVAAATGLFFGELT